MESHVTDIVKRAIVCAETKNFDESLRLFDEALRRAPNSPSILNDRAQALRLANRNEGIFRVRRYILQRTFRRQTRRELIYSQFLFLNFMLCHTHTLEALKDLTLAVELSKGNGRAGIRALCQRGALYRWMKQDENARVDFARAARAGSSFARSQLVALNPYAAMCNSMLCEIMAKNFRS